jgi:hypothetical protein
VLAVPCGYLTADSRAAEADDKASQKRGDGDMAVIFCDRNINGECHEVEVAVRA